MAAGNKRAMHYCQPCASEYSLCRGYTIHSREIGFAVPTGHTLKRDATRVLFLSVLIPDASNQPGGSSR